MSIMVVKYTTEERISGEELLMYLKENEKTGLSHVSFQVETHATLDIVTSTSYRVSGNVVIVGNKGFRIFTDGVNYGQEGHYYMRREKNKWTILMVVVAACCKSLCGNRLVTESELVLRF